MLLLAAVFLLAFSWFAKKYGKLYYTRNYLWKGWVSPPLDNFMNGHKPSFRKAQEENNFNALMCGWVKAHGDTILLWRDFRPLIFTTDPEVLEEVWGNLNCFVKLSALPNRTLFEIPITGIKSFLTTRGGLTWATKRKILSGFFTKANQNLLFPTMQQLVNKSISDLKQSHPEHLAYDMELGFATMAENLLLVCGLDKLGDMFSTRPGYLAKNVLNLLEILPLAMHKQIGKEEASVVQGISFLTDVRQEITAAYHEIARKSTSREASLDNKMAILELLVTANKDLMGQDDCENFVNDIMTLILVADNISKVVSILFAKVLREEGVYEKMEEEALNTELSCYEDLKKLKYIELVILETMRWSPILQRGARGFNRYDPIYKAGGLTLKGKKIPYVGQCDVQWSQYVMHHNDKYWPDHDKFDPERFRNGTADIVRNSYIPFIGGPRACLGKHLAMAKMKTMIHAMLRNFKMSIVPGEEKLVLDKKYTIVKVRQGKNIMLKSH